MARVHEEHVRILAHESANFHCPHSPEGNRVHIPNVPLEAGGTPPSPRVEEAHRPVPPSRRQTLAIGAEGSAPDERTEGGCEEDRGRV